MNDQRVRKCPYCGSVWLIEHDDLCNRCHRAIDIEGENAPVIYDFIL